MTKEGGKKINLFGQGEKVRTAGYGVKKKKTKKSVAKSTMAKKEMKYKMKKVAEPNRKGLGRKLGSTKRKSSGKYKKSAPKY